jgi:multiple sugar transport system substrate-binding protein
MPTRVFNAGLTRRRVAGGAVALAGGLGLAACGVGGSAATPAKVSGTVTFGLKGGTPPQLAAVDEAVARFQKQFPDVQVKTDHFFGGDKNWLDVFLAKRAADTLPDTFGIIEYNQGVVWAYQGTVQAIDGFIKQDKSFKLDDYAAGPVNAYKAGGKLWGIPQTPNPVMLYYNRAQLDKTGQQPPSNDWDTDKFLDTVKRATTGVGTDQVVWGYAFNRRWSLMLGWLAAFGGSMTSADRTKFTMDTADALAALQYDVDLIYKHRTGPPPDPAVGSAVGLLLPSPAQFNAGNVAYTLDGIAGAPGYKQSIGDKFGWDVLPLPKGPKGRGSTLSGDGWWIKKETKVPQAAWELVKVMVGEEHQRAQLQAAALYPSLKRLVPDYFKLTNVKNQDAVVMTAEQIGIPFPVTPSFSTWTAEILAPAMTEMWNNKKTPKDAMSGIASQINALLAEDAKAAKL